MNITLHIRQALIDALVNKAAEIAWQHIERAWPLWLDQHHGVPWIDLMRSVLG